MLLLVRWQREPAMSSVLLPPLPRRGSKFAFDTVMALGNYHDELRSAVLRIKLPAGETLANTMGRLLAHQCRAALEQFAPTAIVAVPMHWTRRIARGMNNPELLAAAVGKALGVRVAWRGLVRRRRTAHQNELLPEHRAENVRGAFRVGLGRHFRQDRVLLIDDVLTTGSTANEAAGVVRRGCAARRGDRSARRAGRAGGSEGADVATGRDGGRNPGRLYDLWPRMAVWQPSLGLTRRGRASCESFIALDAWPAAVCAIQL